MEVCRARLNAAAALIPIIESGLANSKLNPERAALMCEFCLWTTKADFGECDQHHSTSQSILAGLGRIKGMLTKPDF